MRSLSLGVVPWHHVSLCPSHPMHSFVQAMRAFHSEAEAVASLRAIPTKGQQLGPKVCKLLYNFYVCHDFTAFVPSGATGPRRR